MSRRELLRLGDIREAIATIRSHIASGLFDRKTSDAVLYNLVVIGEAAAQISDETRLAPRRSCEAPGLPFALASRRCCTTQLSLSG